MDQRALQTHASTPRKRFFSSYDEGKTRPILPLIGSLRHSFSNPNWPLAVVLQSNQSAGRKQPFFRDRPGEKNVPIRDDSLLHISAFDPEKGARSAFLCYLLPVPGAFSLFQHVKSPSEREPREMRGLPNQNDV